MITISKSTCTLQAHSVLPYSGFKICQDIHDNLLKIDGVDDVKVNVSNHFMAEQINNQVNNSPIFPHKFLRFYFIHASCLV